MIQIFTNLRLRLEKILKGPSLQEAIQKAIVAENEIIFDQNKLIYQARFQRHMAQAKIRAYRQWITGESDDSKEF